MAILVCLDRDGTVIKDEDYYLGCQDNWQDLVQLSPGVVEGIKKLKEQDDVYIWITTNQAGVALTEGKYAQLTEERMHAVNSYVLAKLEEAGASINGYVACPFVDNAYLARKKRSKPDLQFDPRYVRDGHPFIKPALGMLEEAARLSGLSLDSVEAVYVVGDRISDVEFGLRARGKGVLVPGWKTAKLNEVAATQALMEEQKGLVFITQENGFLEGIEWIVADILRIRSQ